MNDQKTIAKEDALSSLKLAFHALIRFGLSIDEIVDHANSILQDLIDSDDISLLSVSNLGIVKDRHIIHYGDLVFDALRRTLFYQGQQVKLSPTEQRLMEYFINNPERLLTHKEISAHLYAGIETKSKPEELCRTPISRLRNKLSTFPEGDRWIETIRGKGYVFKGNQNI